MNHQGSLSLESCCLSVLSRPCWPCCVPWLLSLRVSVTHVSQEGMAGGVLCAWGAQGLEEAAMGTGWGIVLTFSKGGSARLCFSTVFVCKQEQLLVSRPDSKVQR